MSISRSHDDEKCMMRCDNEVCMMRSYDDEVCMMRCDDDGGMYDEKL